jgi:hypothetical protein
MQMLEQIGHTNRNGTIYLLDQARMTIRTEQNGSERSQVVGARLLVGRTRFSVKPWSAWDSSSGERSGNRGNSTSCRNVGLEESMEPSRDQCRAKESDTGEAWTGPNQTCRL